MQRGPEELTHQATKKVLANLLELQPPLLLPVLNLTLKLKEPLTVPILLIALKRNNPCLNLIAACARPKMVAK